MLDGAYVHRVGCSDSLESEPRFLFTEIVAPHSMYEITDPQTWHSVQPLATTYTVMVNGAPWEEQHAETKVTKGVDVSYMTAAEVAVHMSVFSRLLRDYFRDLENPS